MTSKAERKRRKQAARKGRLVASPTPDTILDALAGAALSPQVLGAVELERPPWMLTEKQEAAWAWFRDLRRAALAGGAGATAAREMLGAARAQLTGDEYAVLCELAGDDGGVSIAYRVGRSRTTVRELEISALRKLVVHRFANDLGEGAGEA